MNERAYSFGYWLRRRRKALDLTQEQLAQGVSCSRFAIRKIEADERRPSRRLAERLAERLAVAPEERTAFLHAARALRTPAEVRVGRVPFEEAREPAGQAPFVGRAEQYGRLVGLVARLTSGSGHVVLIEGEPGIGKSRLMSEVTRYAHGRGVPTLETRCYQIERAIPYQPVIDVATQALERAPAAALRKLAPVSLAEIAALVPAVAARFPGLPPLSGDFPEARQARLFRALLELLGAFADGRQLVLAIDDLQWADDASAQFLHYLARQAARRPLLALYALRDEELEADERITALVASLRREPHARAMPLARLRQEDAESLIDALGDARLRAPGLAARLHRETDGNAFFLVSMLHALAEGHAAPEETGDLPLPDALRESVRARLAGVPAAARPVLDVAAVLGRRFGFEILAAVAEQAEEALLRALDVLVKRRLLHEHTEDGSYDFTHDKVREVVYRDISGARRVRLHRAVAEALQAREGEPHEREARLAEHFERAHVWPKALEYLVLSASRSQKLFAMRDALHWLDRAVAVAQAHPEALDDAGRIALHERRGAARAQAGQTEGAVSDIGRVIEAARQQGDRVKARDALIQLGMAYRRADDYDQARACLDQALSESRAMGDERHAADTLYHLGTVAWSNGRNREAIAFHQEAVEICERLALSDLVAVQAFHGRGEAHFADSQPVAAIACYTRSLELSRGIGDKSYESENLMMIGFACTGHMGVGDYARAAAQFEASLAIAESADLQWHLGPTLLGLAHVRACLGSYGEAWTRMNHTLRWLERVRQARYQLIAYDLIGYLLLDLRLDRQAAELLERGIALAEARKVMFWRQRLEANLAIARLRLGRLDVGPALEQALEHSRRNTERYLMLRCLEGLAELALARGEPERCETLASELLSIAEANALNELSAQALRWIGEASMARQQYAPARAALERSGALAENIGRVRLMHDVEVALARVCRQGGQAGQARSHLSRAARIAAGIAASLAGTELRDAWSTGSPGPSAG